MADFFGDIVHMRPSEVIGYIAAALVFATFWMKTMVPLRVVGIASNLFFVSYGYSTTPNRCWCCIAFCCR